MTALEQFRVHYPDDEACDAEIQRCRWPEGFECPACGSGEAWASDRGLHLCRSCRHQASPTAGTALDRTRLPARTWLQAAWLLVARPIPPSATGLQEVLGLGSHETATRMLKTIRDAVAPAAQPPLHGTVCLTVAPIGRGASHRLAAAIAVSADVGTQDPAAVRAQMLSSPSVCSLARFATQHIRPDATLVVDPLPLLRRFVRSRLHLTAASSSEGAVAAVPRKAFVSWLHHVPGGHQVQRVEGLLNEFTFRFANRGCGPHDLFHRLVATLLRPSTAGGEDEPRVIRLGQARTASECGLAPAPEGG